MANFLSKALGRFGVEQRGSRNPTERRSSLENPQTPLSYPAEWLLDIFNGGRTDSGIRVSEMTAIEVTAVLQCINIIANGFAGHPLNVYQRILEKGRTGKKVAYDHPYYFLLHNEPNPEMTSMTWRRVLACHFLLWGNGYAEIQRNGANRIIAIWPRNPARTRPVRLTAPMTIEGTPYPPGTLMYETFESITNSVITENDNANQGYGYRRLVLAEDMIHVPGLSLDGRVGQDTVILGRQAIGLSLAAEKYGAKFFGNGAVPNGILSVPGDMTDIQWETLRRSWMEAHGGENSHRTGVLPPGVTYEKTGSTASEAQLVDVRNHQRLEVASLFNVPPHMLGLQGDDAGKSSVEQSSIEFLLFCLGPWNTAFEQELERKVFPQVGQSANKYFAGIDTRRLMYPDAASRSTLYGSGKQWGYLNTNDIHELEGMNPVEDGSGDLYWMPTNMQDAALSAAHSDAVQDGLSDGTLAAVPSNTKPVGNHPVIKDQQKSAALDRKAKADASAQQAKVAMAQAKVVQKQSQGQSGAQAQEPAKQTKTAVKKAKRAQITKAFERMYRDGIGRASFRNKPTAADYESIFGPIVSAVAELMHEEELDCADFVRSYSEDLFKRCTAPGTWESRDKQAIADAELLHLVKLLEQA